MSMKKILMTAVAVSALTAGAASAASITSARLNGAAAGNLVYDATDDTKVPYKLANETIYGTSGLSTTPTDGHNTVVAEVVSGRLLVGSYTVSYDYSGPVKFARPLLGTDLTADNANLCSMTPTLISGGLATSKTVTYSIAVSGTCAATGATDAAPQSFTLNAPLTVTGAGDVAVSATFGQGGSSIDNGAATARTILTNAAGFTTTATADTVATQWALGTTPVYTTLGAAAGAAGPDDVIGKYTVAGVPGVFIKADGTLEASGIAITADLSLAGDFTKLSAARGGTTAGLTTGGSALTIVTPFAVATASAVAAGSNIKISVAPNAVTASQTAKSFALTVTPKFTTTDFTVPGAFTTALQSIGLEGVNYLAPWVGGNQSSAGTSIRLSNSGVATGAVTLQLGAAVRNDGTVAGATTCTSSTLSKLGSIANGAELVINQADLTTCFGDFKRGDVTITVQASSTSLTAKARNVNAGSGDVTEISLGAS